jgi:hypothetical protein
MRLFGIFALVNPLEIQTHHERDLTPTPPPPPQLKRRTSDPHNLYSSKNLQSLLDFNVRSNVCTSSFMNDHHVHGSGAVTHRVGYASRTSSAGESSEGGTPSQAVSDRKWEEVRMFARPGVATERGRELSSFQSQSGASTDGEAHSNP